MQINQYNMLHQQKTKTTQSSKKTQHPFMIKPLTKMGMEGTYVNMIKTMKKPQPTQYSTLKS